MIFSKTFNLMAATAALVTSGTSSAQSPPEYLIGDCVLVYPAYLAKGKNEITEDEKKDVTLRKGKVVKVDTLFTGNRYVYVVEYSDARKQPTPSQAPHSNIDLKTDRSAPPTPRPPLESIFPLFLKSCPTIDL